MLVNSPFSMLRTLEYEAIEGYKLRGRVLDVGGGSNNSYYHLLDIEGQIESINISPDIEPTHIADLNEPLPFKTGEFDEIISLNTLEHIRNDDLALSEMIRVTRPGGKLTIVVPFLYRVHGSPSDFHRHTAYWWEAKLEQYGCSLERSTIEPLMWDWLGSGLAISEHWVPARCPWPRLLVRIRRMTGLFYGAFYQSLRWPKLERIPDDRSLRERDFALGYLIQAYKDPVR